MNNIYFSDANKASNYAEFYKLIENARRKILNKIHELDNSRILPCTIIIQIFCKFGLYEKGIIKMTTEYLADDPIFAMTKEGEAYFANASPREKLFYYGNGGFINQRIRCDITPNQVTYPSVYYPNGYIEYINVPYQFLLFDLGRSCDLAKISKNQNYIDKHYLYYIYAITENITIPRDKRTEGTGIFVKKINNHQLYLFF
jgi:hypothetical protein